MTRAVVVRSASRTTIDDFEIYRPITMPDTVLIMFMATASDDAIIARVRGLLSNDELAAVADFLGLDPKDASVTEAKPFEDGTEGIKFTRSV